MAKTDITIPVTIESEWVREEADGADCITCGEPIYLAQFRLVARARALKQVRQERTPLVRCQGCYEANQ